MGNWESDADLRWSGYVAPGGRIGGSFALLDNITMCDRVVGILDTFSLQRIRILDKTEDERASRMDNLDRDRDG